jgi:integrase
VGTVFKKQVTKPLPADAEIFTRKGERFARWKSARGKTRTAPLTVGEDGSDRITIESSKWVAKYRDSAGVICVVPTGCRDETNARQVLADLERKAELVRSGVMTGAEEHIGRHQATPLAQHLAAFNEHLTAKGTSEIHRDYTARYLRRLAAECTLSTLADLRREALERWLAARANEGLGAKARNLYRGALVSFSNWCVATDRLAGNPFREVAKANEKADRRRQRRAMDEAELVHLLDVARQRPLLVALTVRKGERKGERYANVRPEVRQRLDLLGRERALIYKTLVLTGLRKAELASLTVGQILLDSPVPCIALDAAAEKNREGNDIVLRADLADDLRQWRADMLSRLQEEAQRQGDPIPARLLAETPLFTVPAGLLRILNRDLRLAGIPKRDERGRTLDVHALRTTFGTLLSAGGVAPRTAQAAMRHSDIRLTMGVYTDPKLLDVRGALDVLPALPLDGEHRTMPNVAKATGTSDLPRSAFAPGFAPPTDFPSQSRAIPVKMAGGSGQGDKGPARAVSGTPVKRKEPPTSPVSGCLKSGREDSNLRPHGPEATALPSPKCTKTVGQLYFRPFRPICKSLQTIARKCIQWRYRRCERYQKRYRRDPSKMLSFCRVFAAHRSAHAPAKDGRGSAWQRGYFSSRSICTLARLLFIINPGPATEATGRFPGFPAKQDAQILGMIEARLGGDALEGEIGLQQQQPYTLNSDAADFLARGATERLPKTSKEERARHMRLADELFDSQTVAGARPDRAHRGSHDCIVHGHDIGGVPHRHAQGRNQRSLGSFARGLTRHQPTEEGGTLEADPLGVIDDAAQGRTGESANLFVVVHADDRNLFGHGHRRPGTCIEHAQRLPVAAGQHTERPR